MKEVFHKLIKSERHLIITGAKTKCEICKIKHLTTFFQDQSHSEEHMNFEKEQRNKVKMKCNLCDRTVVRKIWKKHEISVRLKRFIENQSTQLTEITSSQRARNTNNKRSCDLCNIWISLSNMIHDNTKTNKNKVIDEMEQIHFFTTQCRFQNNATINSTSIYKRKSHPLKKNRQVFDMLH